MSLIEQIIYEINYFGKDVVSYNMKRAIELKDRINTKNSDK